MYDDTRSNQFSLNPSDVTIPRGWRIISHGTSLTKWNDPLPSFPQQDLTATDRVVVKNTVDGGLACVGENELNLPRAYAGQDAPVVFRVFVPSDLPNLDTNTANEALRFLKPTGNDSVRFLVPADTVLIKVAEDITEGHNNLSVVWFVPAPFASLLEHDLKRPEHSREQAISADVETPAFDINASFAAAEAATEEEHILEQEEKADEYYEDLEAQQQELLEAEIEAEEEKAAKRAKDKETARAQDKKNFAQAEAEHERQMAEANERLSKQQSVADGYTDPYAYNEPYAYGSNSYENPYAGNQSYSDGAGESKGYDERRFEEPSQPEYTEPYSYENNKYEQEVTPSSYPTEDYNAPETHLPETEVSRSDIVYDNNYSTQEERYEAQPQPEYTEPYSYDNNKQEVNPASYPTEDYSAPEPRASDADVSRSNVTYDGDYSAQTEQHKGYPEPSRLADSETKRRQYIDEDYATEQARREEESARFHDSLQEEARRRQERSESYESFGSSGIDFSGRDEHSSYEVEKQPSYDAQPLGGMPEQTSPRTLSAEDVTKYERDFRSAQESFRSYSGDVPQHVTQAYKDASDRYFSVMRGIDEGFVVVQQPKDNHVVSHNATVVSPGSAASNENSGHQNNAPRQTAQNTNTGDDFKPRKAETVKDPPKSPADNAPLSFSAEKFRAIRRFANNAADGSYRIGSAVKHQIERTAQAEETGTSHAIVSTTRGFSSAIATMDVLANGNGKRNAEQAIKEYIAAEKGIKVGDVSKEDLKEFGKLNLKNLDTKLNETLSDVDMVSMRNKFGKAADLSIKDAIGTKNDELFGGLKKVDVVSSDGSVKSKIKVDNIQVVINGKVNVRAAKGKIGALHTRAVNLKNEIRALEAKGAALSERERKMLSDLKAQKKKVQGELNKTVGAVNTRIKKEGIYRQINNMSPGKLQKELKNLENKLKKGLKLNSVQSLQLSLMRRRAAMMKARQEMGRGGRLGAIAGLAGRRVGKMLRDSNDETFVSMMGTVDNIQTATRFVQTATRFATNRYVRGAMKWAAKTAMLPARTAAWLAKLADRKLGVSKAVKGATSKVAHNAKSRLLHSKPAAKIKTATKRAVGRTRAAYSKSRLKTVVDKSKKAVSRSKKMADAIRKAFEKFNNNPFVKGIKAVFRAPFDAFRFLNGIVQGIKKVVTKYILMPIALFLVGAFIMNVAATLIIQSSSSIFVGPNEKDGKIDLSAYVDVLNEEQTALNFDVASHKNNTEANGGTYKRVFVDYLGGSNNNNFKEILSMTAVYFNQDFSNHDAVKEYIKALYNATNYVTTEVGEKYYCSGCTDRHYLCYYNLPAQNANVPPATAERKELHSKSDHSGEKYVGKTKGCKKSSLYSCMEKGHGIYRKLGCGEVTFHASEGLNIPEDCNSYSANYSDSGLFAGYTCNGHGSCHGKHYDYSCPGHIEKVCYGHNDLYVNVVCMGFDQIFKADPGVTVGKDLGDYKQGDLIGDFNITYYCSCAECCGKSDGITASGTKLTPGRTIATDPDVIPTGSRVIINGHLYVAEDVGGHIKGNRIDIAVASHQEGLDLGRDVFKVYEAVDKDAEEDESTKPRQQGISYVQYAKEAEGDSKATVYLKLFGLAKEPVVGWTAGYKDKDLMFPKETNDTYVKKLHKFDAENETKPFTNVELNTFKYVKMSVDELKQILKDRGLKTDAYVYKNQIIEYQLIPYDKEHPDCYLKDPEEDTAVEEYYFDGWTNDNKEWTKNIYQQMTSEIYYGLDGIVGGDRPSSIPLEGIEIKGSKITVKYYCQKDYPTTPVIPAYPQYTIKTSGCGFTSMSIVVSSLTNKTVDPPAMVNKYGKSHYSPGNGAYHSIVQDVSEDYGLSCTELSVTNIQGVINALNEGKLVVVLVGRNGVGFTGSGYYKGAGHFLVISGVTSDGKFLLADPNQKEVSLSGKGVAMQHFVDSGIKKIWVVGK